MTNICGISAAESNRTSLRAIEEDPNCWSVTPASGKTRELRVTSSSLTSNKETAVSDEIRADRMVSSISEVGASSGGDINFEFSAGSLDDFLQAFLGGTWSKPMTFDKFKGATVSFGATNRIDISGGDYTAYFVANRWVKTEGFLTNGNNNYWQIASVAFASGSTQITTVASTATIEAGSAVTAVMDANDFIVRSTAIRAGTSGANAFDSNGGNAFATAIAAGFLKVGQRISVEGLGYNTGSVDFAAGLQTDGDIVTIGDGEKTVVFEFDSNGAFTRGREQVVIGVDEDATATNLHKAIMKAFAEKKLAVYSVLDVSGVGTAVVNLKNTRAGGGGSLSETSANLTVTAFAGYTNSYGVFTITALTDDVITVAETVATNANASTLSVAIKGSHLRNPGTLADIKRRSFSIETGFTDVNQYFLMKGLRVGSFGLSISAGEIMTGQVALEGKDTVLSTSTVLGTAPYTPLASTSTEVLNATTNVGQIRKNGVELATAIQSIEINGEASLRQQPGVSSKYPVGIGLGRLNFSGTIMAYFETLDMYNHFLNHDTIGLAFDFRDNDSNAYSFNLPAVKLTSDPVAPGGIDQYIMEEIEWAAQRDPSLNTMMLVDRMSSLVPAAL